MHDLPGIIDLNYGDWQGMPLAEVQVKYADLYRQWETAPHTVRFPNGETLDEVKGFIASEQLWLGNVLLDDTASASTVLGVQAYPSTLFFDAEGRLRELHLGELTAAGLEHKLRRLR